MVGDHLLQVRLTQQCHSQQLHDGTGHQTVATEAVNAGQKEMITVQAAGIMQCLMYRLILTRRDTLIPPADSPNIVTKSESPPKL